MKMKSILVICSMSMVASCGGLLVEGDRNRLVKRASFELNCVPNSLELIELSSIGNRVQQYGVTGCGKRAVYVLDHNNRQWILNSEEK